MKPIKKKIALTLAGGGARGAYEAGVLRAISEMGQFGTCPFEIITGVSAGAINGTCLAAGADDFDQVTKKLWDTWDAIRTEDVIKTDAIGFAKTGGAWLVGLSLGQMVGSNPITHLLDTSPLFGFLKDRIDPAAIVRNVREGVLRAVSLSATDYRSGHLVTFFDGDEAIPSWNEVSSRSLRTPITISHIMASTAIPVFFPPVEIDDCEYGDGGIGLRSPLSDAIHLGAERILVIDLQHRPNMKPATPEPRHAVTLGDIAGTILNSLFLNSLDSDLARLEQANRLVSEFTVEGSPSKPGATRAIPALVVQPSEDLGHIDTEDFRQLPFPLRHMLKGLGVTEDKGWALMTYLAFEKGYVGRLLQLGYDDAMAMKGDILEFLQD